MLIIIMCRQLTKLKNSFHHLVAIKLQFIFYHNHFSELNERKSSSSSSGSLGSPKHQIANKKQNHYSPSRKRGHGRSISQSPRRKTEHKTSPETKSDRTRKEKSQAVKKLCSIRDINDTYPRCNSKDAGSNREGGIVPKIEDNGENIPSSLMTNNEVLHVEKRSTESNLAVKTIRDKYEVDSILKSKQPHAKKKPMRSPRQIKTIKVCKPHQKMQVCQ